MAMIPLRVDVPTDRTPWVNYALMGLCVLCYFAAPPGSESFYDMAGMQVTETFFGDEVVFPSKPTWIIGFTSLFAHAGLIHLVGNMLFLWIFGNAINYKFGHLGYAAVFLLGGWLAYMIHLEYEGGPAVGASGAIYAVMGAFLVFFPRNDITAVWVFLPIATRTFTVSSGWLLVYFIGWDILYLTVGADAGVAFAAHVGGFVCGLLAAVALAALGVVRATQDEQTLLGLLRRG
ncbi:MAG: rhomboid family intramembrane serine protease [Phycisphaerae bacterium]